MEDCWVRNPQTSTRAENEPRSPSMSPGSCLTPQRWDDLGSMQVHVSLLHTVQENTLNQVHSLEMQMGLVEQQLQQLKAKELTEKLEQPSTRRKCTDRDLETQEVESRQQHEEHGGDQSRGLRSIANSIASSTAKGFGATESSCKRAEGARSNWREFLMAVSVVSLVSVLMSGKGIVFGDNGPKAAKTVHHASPYDIRDFVVDGKGLTPQSVGAGSSMTIHASGELSMHTDTDDHSSISVMGQSQTPAIRYSNSSNPSELTEIATAILEGNEGWTALHAASSVGNADVVKAIMQRHQAAEVNAKDAHGCTALHLAAARGNLEVVVALLNNSRFMEANAKDANGRTALHHSARAGHTPIVKLLLEHAGDGQAFTQVNEKDNDGKTALHHATFFGRLGSAVTLMNDQQFTEVNSKDASRCTALHFAAASGHIDVTEAVMNHTRFTEVNAMSIDGWTVLNYAIDSGYVDVAKAILKNKRFTNVNTRDDRGWSVLHFAASSGYIGIAQAIIHHQPFTEVNAKSVDGSSALHIAVDGGHAKIVGVLLNVQQLAVNDKDGMGWTALHHAVSKNRMDIVEIIMKHSRFTGIKAKDNLGRTALEVAETMRHAAVAETISHHLAKLEAPLEAHLLEMIEPGG